MTVSDRPTRASPEFKARYEALFAATGDGVILWNRDGLIEAFNPAAENIFGYAAAEICGREIAELLIAEERGVSAYAASSPASGACAAVGSVDRRIGRRRSGETFPMEIAIAEIESQGQLAYLGVVRDLTPQKRLEDVLCARENELREVVDNVPVGIFTAELPGFLHAGNPALQRLTKYEADELAGMSLAHLFTGDDYCQLTSMIADLAHGIGAERMAELRMRRRDDAVLEVSLHIGLVPRAGNTPLVVGMVTDRTEKLRSEEVARQAREHLAHVGRLTTLGEMASAIAHEINQPLTAIANHAQAARRLLAMADHDVETVQEACAQIAEQALRAGQVVRRIRAFVTKRESHKEVTALNEIVRSVLELAAGDAREARARIDLRLVTPSPSVLVDSVQIQQVCLNLIRNSIDAMRDVPSEKRLIEIEARVHERRCLIHFDDRGPGVGKLARDRLFHPFFTTKPDGMGMGLSISRSIMIAHGGTLRYETNPYGGARFVLDLPLAGV